MGKILFAPRSPKSKNLTLTNIIFIDIMHQILYQAADKLTNTLQNNNKIDPLLIIGGIVLSVAFGYALYVIQTTCDTDNAGRN